MTSWFMPMCSHASFVALLEGGWTCFQHGGRYWLTVRVPFTRVMIPVPDWIVNTAIAQSQAHQVGVRILPTFTLFSRRTA